MRVDEVTNWDAYSLDCPQGEWVGRLEKKAWANRSLVLYFCEHGTGNKYRFSIFSDRGYRAQDGSGPNFKTDVQAGDLVALTMGKTTTGHAKLLSARTVGTCG